MNKYIKLLLESILNEARVERTIDKKLWLTISSTISRNRSSEAEFIKPMKRLTKDELILRYVAALLITKKPCPKSLKDIETLKTFKLFALKALELGATIQDILDLYNQNSGITTSNTTSVNNVVSTNTKPAKANKQLKYIDILNSFISRIDIKRYKNEIADLSLYTYKLEDKQVYKLAEPAIAEYIRNIVRKSHYTFDGFALLILKDFNEFYKIFDNTLINVKRPEKYIEVSKYTYSSHSTFGSYKYYFCIDIMPTSYKMYTEGIKQAFSDDRKSIREYTRDDIFKNLTKCKIDGTEINLLQEFCKSVFINVVKYYVMYLGMKQSAENKLTYQDTLKKYNMSENGTGNFRWLKTYIKQILKNNAGTIIYVKYSDWSGGIKSFEYDSNRDAYYVNIWMENSNSDSSDGVYLDRLLNSSGSFRYRRDDYSISIHDLDALGNRVYEKVKDMIINGQLT